MRNKKITQQEAQSSRETQPARVRGTKTAQKKTNCQSAPPVKNEPKTLYMDKKRTETKADARAHTSLRPTVQAALTLGDYNKGFGEMSLNTLVDDLVQQCDRANKGDLSRAEAILVAQAHTLDAIFNTLARSAMRVEQLGKVDISLRLAFKAQAQCRATLEALAAVKNPKPVAYVGQANIAHGPQQVNNEGSKSETGYRASALGKL